MIKNWPKLTPPTAPLPFMARACQRASTQPPAYGAKVHYVQGQPLHFPDLNLEFVGRREVPASTDYPRAMTFYDFKVYQGSETQLVSWSAGTGDIGPTLFEVAGQRYTLELARSDTLGALAEAELVLWREAMPATAAPTPTP